MMLRLALALVVSLAACGGPRSPAPGDGASSGGDDAAGTGGPGAICALGEQNTDPDAVAVTCAEGLRCCYPCGIPGCDSVCMEDCGPPRP